MDGYREKTLAYYRENAQSFIDSTVQIDFTSVQDRFIALLPKDARVLDFGCGAGRDTAYFISRGIIVDAVDGSEEMVAAARELTGTDVRQMLFTELDCHDLYDGIWACSSILHCPVDELREVFLRMIDALINGGILYTSFKYGTFEGERNGRYFTNMTEDKFNEFIKGYPMLSVEDLWITGDVRPGRGDEKWLNLIMRKAASGKEEP